MKLNLDFQPQKLYSAVHELIRMVFPEYEISLGYVADEGDSIALCCDESEKNVVFSGKINVHGLVTEDRREYAFDLDETGRSKQVSRFAKVFVYHLLCRHCGENINPYGILTGVRPVKIVHRLLDQGEREPQVIKELQNKYLMEESKAERLTEIALNNRTYLHSGTEAKKKISVYIGIPFCPSRCYYCSFPGAIALPDDPGLNAFLLALQREMEGIGDCINELGLSVENIYIGGGTPSILAEAELERLFAQIHKNLISSETTEMTIEAGRPDTLSPSKFTVFKNAGINRVCINPQTMQDATLSLIGRRHTADDIKRVVEWSREAGIETINMDLIIGLPGEGLKENMKTCKELLALKPENISVHSLAVKKGSLLAETEGKSGVHLRMDEVKNGIEYFWNSLKQSGYLPYYMYRQKYMKASLENTAYSLKGHFCRYNIQVMEERQTIVGMGGAAGTKIINPDDWTLINLHNPKDPHHYCQKVDLLVAGKVDKLRALN